MNFRPIPNMLLAMTFAVFSAGCVSSQEASRAMYDWEMGSTAAYEVVQAQGQSIEIPGQGVQESSSNVTTKMTVDATGPFEFKVTVTDATATGSPIPIDPLIGLESNIVLRPNGRIDSASGLSENAFVDGMGGEAVYRDGLQTLFQILPEETLAPGVEWDYKYSLAINRMGLDIVRDVTVTYRCTQATTFAGTAAFEIETSSEVSMSGSGNQGGQDMDLLIQGTMTGKTFIEVSTGRLLSTESSGGLAGVIDMAEASLPITIDMTESVKLGQ